jgi:F-type H+-transporting ATPase subunit epsilon
MDGPLQVSIVTPEATVFGGPADAVVVPGHDGEVAFLPNHAPYVGLLGVGEVRLREPGGGTRHWFLAGGVVQVADDVVSVLAESVTPVAAIDARKAAKDLESALARPAADPAAVEARARAQAEARAKLRLAAKAGDSPLGGTGAPT